MYSGYRKVLDNSMEEDSLVDLEMRGVRRLLKGEGSFGIK